MQKIWNWTKENAATLAAVGGLLAAFAGIVQFAVLSPIHQRFDAINQRFDAVDQCFDAQDQRFDAQSRRLDDLKADMGQRFDTQDKHINQRFDAQDKHINQRFDAQDKYISQRFDAVDQRLDGLENDVSELRKLSERVSRNEGQIQVIRQQLQTADAPAP